MTEVSGLDIIAGLAGEPPNGIFIGKKLRSKQQLLISQWNGHYIAVVLYCYKCKEPLTWHTEPKDDNIVFHCPRCKRIWMTEEEDEQNKENTQATR